LAILARSAPNLTILARSATDLGSRFLNDPTSLLQKQFYSRSLHFHCFLSLKCKFDLSFQTMGLKKSYHFRKYRHGGHFAQEWLNFGALRARMAKSLGDSRKSCFSGELRAKMGRFLRWEQKIEVWGNLKIHKKSSSTTHLQTYTDGALRGFLFKFDRVRLPRIIKMFTQTGFFAREQTKRRSSLLLT